MIFASIDIGSNTIRLLVAEDDGLDPLSHERAITCLAKGIESTGKLNPEGVSNSLDAIKKFMQIVSDHSVSPEHIIVGATSALREGADADEFIARAHESAGANIHVLTESEEANATALGIMAGFPDTKDAFLLDIGGGSTEAIAVLGGKVRSWHSETVGVVKLIDRHIHSDPPTKAELETLNRESDFIAGEIFKTFDSSVRWNDIEFIATAGTATTAASVDLSLSEYDRHLVNGHEVTRKSLYDMYERFSLMSLSERSQVPGLGKGREDLIIPGLALTISIMNMFGFNSMKVSDNGLLEGLCLLAMGGAVELWKE